MCTVDKSEKLRGGRHQKAKRLRGELSRSRSRQRGCSSKSHVERVTSDSLGSFAYYIYYGLDLTLIDSSCRCYYDMEKLASLGHTTYFFICGVALELPTSMVEPQALILKTSVFIQYCI